MAWVQAACTLLQLWSTLWPPWTVARQAPLSMGFWRQEYRSGLPCPSPGESSWLRDRTFVSCSSCIAGRFFTSEPPRKLLFIYYNGVQTAFSSVAQSCPTLCDPMNCSTPGLPVHHQLPEFTQTHVHRVSDAIQPSHPLSSPSPPAPNPSQHQSLFQWVNSSHTVNLWVHGFLVQFHQLL